MTLNFTTEDAGIILTTTSAYPVIIEDRLTTHRGATCRPGGGTSFPPNLTSCQFPIYSFVGKFGNNFIDRSFSKTRRMDSYLRTSLLPMHPTRQQRALWYHNKCSGNAVNHKQSMVLHFIEQGSSTKIEQGPVTKNSFQERSEPLTYHVLIIILSKTINTAYFLIISDVFIYIFIYIFPNIYITFHHEKQVRQSNAY